jgi:hypothetical protein
LNMPTWSYSSLKTFQQCPKKYFHIKVAKDVVDRPHESAMYGSAVHKAAEDHVAEGVPIPAKYDYIVPTIEALKKIPGEKYCEIKLGVTEKLEACDYSFPDAWWHGIVDLLIVNEDDGIAHMVDYKTSKNARYADTKQLDYMAVAVFAKFPKIKVIKSALLFVVSNEFVQKKHVVENMQLYMNSATFDLNRLRGAFKSGVWNPISGPLCKFCPVHSCEHNRS